MKAIFLFFALFSTTSAALIPLAHINGSAIYDFSQHSQVLVISDGLHGDLLKTIRITQGKANITKTAYDLSIPDANGKLTAWINLNEGYDLIQIATQNGSNYNIPGYIYIRDLGDSFDANIFVQRNGSNSHVSLKGTNIFFPFNAPAGKISVVSGLHVPAGSAITGFVGLPTNTLQVFDSSLFDTIAFYDQLDFPVNYFYLVSTDTEVHYTVGVGAQITNQTVPSLSTAGLVLTSNYPAVGVQPRKLFVFNNPNNTKAGVHLAPSFVNSADYTTNITLTSSGRNAIVPYHSQSDVYNIEADTLLQQIIIDSDGPYALQFAIRDLSGSDNGTVTTPGPQPGTGTTPNPLGSTTQGAESASRIFSVLVSLLMFWKFL